MKKLFMAFFVLLTLTMTASSQRGSSSLNSLLNQKFISRLEPWDNCNFEGTNIGKQTGFYFQVKSSTDRLSKFTACFVGSPNKNYVDYIVLYMDTRNDYKEELYNATFFLGFVTNTCFSATNKTTDQLANWLGKKLGSGQIGDFETTYPELGVNIEVEHYKNLNRGSFEIHLSRYGQPASASWARYCVFN